MGLVFLIRYHNVAFLIVLRPFTFNVIAGIIGFKSTVLLFVFYFSHLFFLIIYFWLCWVFIAAHGLSVVALSGGYFSLAHGLFIAMASRCGARALGAGLSSCSTQAQ